jgi:predicted permease
MSVLLAEQLLVLLSIAAIGYLCVRIGLLSANDCKPLSTLIIYVILPCVIIKSMQLQLTEENLHGFFVAVTFAFIVHIVWIICTAVLRQKVPLSGIEQATLIYTNSGNMIIPLVTALFGEKYVFYACLFNAVQQIFLWTQGISVVSDTKSWNLRQLLSNVNIISVVIGLALFFLQIKLPHVIYATMEMMGNMVGPLSMLVIGMIMAEKNLSAVFSNLEIYKVCIGRLLIYPLIIIILTAMSGYIKLHPDDLFILEIAMLSVAAPPAIVVSQFAVMYNKDAFVASSCNVLSVIACIITMPFIMWIFTNVVIL